VCLLDIPVHKTGHAFTKPVDALVGEAILAWEKIRPEQPQMIDGKTGEATHFLFCYRAHRLRKEYLNLCLIPTLCQKAGVPRTDACGSISSHRARSTIASQLFNAREPMTLFELQAWLGHQSPATTQHYVSTSPTKLTQAYRMRAISLAMFARSRYSLTGMPSPAKQQRMALLGVIMTWGMVGAAMNFSISVLTAWHALAVTSTCRKPQSVVDGWKHERDCSRCFRKFLSAMRNEPQWMEMCKP